MTQPIHDILQQLGTALTAHLDAANDRAVAAETEYARLRDGLRALVGGEPAAHKNIAAAATPELATAKPKANPGEKNGRRRSTIPNEPFFDALTFEWQSAHTLRNAMIASGVKVAFGTVYKRMKRLAVDFPHQIEREAKPDRWRLRVPTGADKDSASMTVTSKPAPTLTKMTPPANEMPPSAITNVPALVAAEPAARELFRPSLHHGDCFEVMKSIPDNSVDLILVDPPFGLTGLKIDPLIDLDAMWAAYRRIITPTGTVVAFGSQPFSSRLVCGAPDLFKHDLIWIKNRATGALQARNRPLKQHEDILVFSAGTTIQANRSSRRYTYNPLGQRSAGIRVASAGTQSTHLRNVKHNPGRQFEGTTNNPRTSLFCPKDGNLHPFQKPVAILEYLIRTYSDEGDVVLDSFLGSGSTCVAAMKAGRRSIGIETDADHFAAAAKRINNTLIPARAA